MGYKLNFNSFDTIRLGNWLVKISSLSDQILICSMNTISEEFMLHIFTDESEAFNFLERYND